MRRFLFIGILLIAFADGCAYFNTFYMAQRNFNDAEKQLQKEKGSVTGTSRKYFNDAVEGAARLIRDYPSSKYVDDSLYIIGVSYFRLKDYTRALTKFNEILTAFPESEYAPDAKYYKAKCLIELDKYDDAQLVLDDLVSTGNRFQKGRAGIALVGIAVREKDWENLMTAAQNVIDSNPEMNELYQAIVFKSEALYNLEQYDECVKTLEGLLKNKLDADIRLKANLQIALAKAKLGKFDESLNYLTSMQNKGEFAPYDPRIRLQIGKIYELQNEPEKAIDTYQKLAGDYPDSLASNEAWYRLGMLQIKDFSNLDEAKEAFDKAKVVKTTVTESWLSESTNMSMQLSMLKNKIEAVNQLKDDPVKRAHERFSLAELYTFAFNRPDSALTQYRMILEEAPDTDFAVRSDYFLKLHELKSENKYSEEADRKLMHEIIEKYPKSNFSQELRVYLGIIEKPPQIKAFQEAEEARISGKSPDAYMPLYQAVVDSFPDTKSAYQARFVMAYCYEHDVGNKDKAMELYTELSKMEENVYSKEYVKLTKDKLEHMKEEPKLLKDIEKNIAYLTFDIGKISSETTEKTEQAVATTGQENELTGSRKIRERNARIRSRYYSD